MLRYILQSKGYYTLYLLSLRKTNSVQWVSLEFEESTCHFDDIAPIYALSNQVKIDNFELGPEQERVLQQV